MSDDPIEAGTTAGPATDGHASDRRVTRLEAELADRTAELDRLRVEYERQRRALDRSEANLRALRSVPLVRLGLATKAGARRVRAEAGPTIRTAAERPRRVAGRMRAWVDDRRNRASLEQEAALAAQLRADIPPAVLSGGPRVSIVMLNRDGESRLRRVLPGLATTSYRDLELIVVDNGSTDRSVAVLEAFEAPFPIVVLRNDSNKPFDQANDQALGVATGDHVLFLNNDVEPITPDWLGHMVETLQGRAAAAVGARLIYPSHRGVARAGRQHRDLTLQHRGITFDRSIAGVPFPRVIGAGEDPRSAAAAAVVEVPAATAACLLVGRQLLDKVGGFGTGYDYGLEDVDLCLRIREAGGTIWYDGRAALWHHEASTRRSDQAIWARRETNRRQLIDRWGVRLTREVLADAIVGGGSWTGSPLHVGITVTRDDPTAGYGDWYTGHELGEALEAMGWRVSYLERHEDRWYRPPEDLDVVVVLIDSFDLRRLPRRIVSVAWARNWPTRWAERTWFDDYDIVLASSRGIADVFRQRTAAAPREMPIATNPDRFRPVEPDPDLACDVLFAGNYWAADRGISRALPRLAAAGFTVHVYGRGWEQVPGMADLHRGSIAYERLPVAYASAGVVVDDTAYHARPYGAVNSRVFDVIASGALLITDNPAGVAELFGVAPPSWDDAESLEAGVRALLADPAAARAAMAPVREIVLAGHTYRHRAAAVRAVLADWIEARRLGIRIGVPSWDVAGHWGDLYFARALQRQFERRGMPTRIHILPEWDSEESARDDATLHLFGLKTPRNRAGQVNLLWQISHPDLASSELYDGYDAAFVASDRFAGYMETRTSTSVQALHQATDPDRFQPTQGGPPNELLFVANARRARRKIIDDLAGTPFDLAVYGGGWDADLIDLRLVRGDHIPNDRLAAFYSAADIVLNDHWADMRDWGFLSNRLYDALACGACVVSDPVAGLDEEFDGAIATYRDRSELVTLLDRLLTSPGERRERGTRGRSIVLARHTFERRCESLLEVLGPLLDRRPPRITDGSDHSTPGSAGRLTPRSSSMD